MKKIVFFFSFVCVCIAIGEIAPNNYVKTRDVLTSEAISVDSTSGDIVTLEPEEEIIYSLKWYEPLITWYVPNYSARIDYSRIASDRHLIYQTSDGEEEGSIVWNYLDDENVDITKTYRLTHTISSNNVDIVSSAFYVTLIPEPIATFSVFLIVLGFFMRKHRNIFTCFLLISIISSQSLFADVSIDSIKLKSRKPWDNKIDIEYELSSKSNSDVFEVKFQGQFDDDEKFDLVTLDGEGACGIVLGAGKHIITWDMGEDKPNIKSDNFRVTVEAKEVTNNDYLILNLFSFKMRASKNPPKNISSNLVCRTDELWFKRCEAGSFLMGSPETEVGSEEYRNRETQHKVKISRPFYISIFEFTNAQRALVRELPALYTILMENGLGDYPALGKMNKHSYTPFFGGFSLGKTGEDTICAILQKKTGLYFELPTEAQWEYSCRAGTSSAIYNGEELIDPVISTNLDLIAVYEDNTTGTYARVGTKLPNAWGIYDMLGNVPEVVLDVDIFEDTSTDRRSNEDVTDPLYVKKSSRYRIFKRGGGYQSPAKECRSSFVDKVYSEDTVVGRLSLQFPGQNK